MASAPVKVFVTGDVVVDHHVYEGQGRDKRSLLREGTILTKSGGGARLLYELLAACQQEHPAAWEALKKIAIAQAEAQAARKGGALTDDQRRQAEGGVDPAFLDLRLSGPDFQPKLGRDDLDALTSMSSCGLYRPALAKPVQPGCDDCDLAKPEKVWRLREPLGYSPRGEPAAKVDELRDDEAANAAGIWVLDDAGLGFRHRSSRPAWPPRLRDGSGPLPNWMVLKAAAPLAAGDLWSTIASGAGPSPAAATEKGVENAATLRDRLVVVVSADDVRCGSVALNRSGSWERTAEIMAQALRSGPALLPLNQCRYLAVLIGVEGALLADYRQPQRPSFHLLFHPSCVEGEWLARIDGDVFGKLSCFTAGIVAHLPTTTAGSADPAHERARLLSGMRAGLAAIHRLVECGHGKVAHDVVPAPPLLEVAREILQPSLALESVAVPEPEDAKVVAAKHATKKVWRILEGQTQPHPAARTGRTLGLARLVGRFGIRALHQVPFLSIGALQSVDREEMENLRSIVTLISNYQHHPRPKRPLSIGVFGQPGSGKSYGVKQIAKSVFGAKAPVLEFNLSQLSVNDDTELIGAFHQIRDKVLEGYMPIVFWDEFDASSMQWLARLLAPMQDGAFLDQQHLRPIGKCVFVFAGGTSYDFDSFGPPDLPEAMRHDLSEVQRARYDQEHRQFRERKGPDFKSRLAAYLNVAGPNVRRTRSWERDCYEVDRTDTGFPLRRALMLRSQFNIKPNDPFDIDATLLTALLQVSLYRHGARSLEKLAELILSRSRGGPVRLSHLPPDQLLDLHVDAEEFRRLLERDYAFQRLSDRIAPHIHWHYLSDAQKAGRDVQVAVQQDFDQLSFALQQDNVAAARRIPEVLAMAGLELVDASQAGSQAGDDDAEVARRIKDQIELLAEAEHVGWADQKLQNDWRYSAVRNDKEQLHDCLLPYAQLTEEQKQKDRDQVSHYPDIARAANFKIKLIRG